MKVAPLVIRVDASVAIGTGHAMRCLALAQAWQDSGGDAAFAMAESTPAIQARLVSEKCKLIGIEGPAGSATDSRETARLASEHDAKWIVVDGYHFDNRYAQSLQNRGYRILWLDDYAHSCYYAGDLVLNPNIGARLAWYPNRGAKTRFLLGPRFAPVRREFSSWRDWRRTLLPQCRNLLVTMGGSDPENLTGRVIEALRIARVAGMSITILVGGSNKRLEEIESAARGSGLEIAIETDVIDVGPLMSGADIAISAAGSTCFELCLLGLPALIVDVAENQTAAAQEWHSRKCFVHVGGLNVTPELLAEELKKLISSVGVRCELSERCHKVVDGNGAARVVSALRNAERMVLRPAVAGDERLLWEWANDPEVREASFSTSPIPWEVHAEWFAKKLAANETLILLAQHAEQAAFGQVRFELQGNEAEINVSLSRESRGRGFSAAMIEAAVRELMATRDCTAVHAFVKPENVASIRAFERAGFVKMGDRRVRGSAALHFLYKQD